MKIGLCTIAFRERPFEAVLDLAVAAGFDGVEPWGKPDHLPAVYDAGYTRQMAEAVRTRGLEVAQFGSYANPTSQAFEQEMEDAIRISQDFETDKIRVWVGNTGSAEADAGQWEKAISGFQVFADRAKDAGMLLVVEMHNGRLSDTAEGCLRLVEGVDRSNFRMNFQPMYHHTPAEMMETLRQVATYVTTVHAQNYVATGSNERALIEQGLVNYRAVVEELKQVGFDGYLEVEFVKEDDPEALKADAAFLRTLC